MPKPNHDLVSIKIKKNSRQRLQVIKAFHPGYTALGKSDYAMLEARIRSMETAFKMQAAAPEVFDIRKEDASTR